MYTAEAIKIPGQLDVCVKYQAKKYMLPLLIWSGASLLGRNWLKHMRPNWQAIHLSKASDVSIELKLLLDKYKVLFPQETGTIMKTFLAKVSLKKNTRPRFYQSCSVPYALKDTLDAELK